MFDYILISFNSDTHFLYTSVVFIVVACPFPLYTDGNSMVYITVMCHPGLYLFEFYLIYLNENENKRRFNSI